MGSCFFDSDASSVTSKLRYYPKEYVQKFMAEAMSFVLRNAPDEQLKRGIRRVVAEAVKKSSPCRESGVELLLYNIMKDYSSRFHSKAERVIQLLASETIYPISDEADQGSPLSETRWMWSCTFRRNINSELVLRSNFANHKVGN